MEDRSIEYPDYYLKPFHAYETVSPLPLAACATSALMELPAMAAAKQRISMACHSQYDNILRTGQPELAGGL